MTADLTAFLQRLGNANHTVKDRAVAVIWHAGLTDPAASVDISDICRAIEKAGFAAPNRSRLKDDLARDTRVASAGKGLFKLRINKRSLADSAFNNYIEAPAPRVNENAFLPSAVFTNSRGYIERVVQQINASYQFALYDCCTVMIRRLLETLIIEVYEIHRRDNEIKNGQGFFFMLSGLVEAIEKQTHWNLGRNARHSLKSLKEIGDLSAHNRRYIARKDDLDRHRDGLRLVTEELVHLCGFSRP
jgi:hypothetical protein